MLSRHMALQVLYMVDENLEVILLWLIKICSNTAPYRLKIQENGFLIKVKSLWLYSLQTGSSEELT